MKLSKREYAAYVARIAPRSKVGRDVAMAFLIGGAICVLGQAVTNGLRAVGLGQEAASGWTSIALIGLSIAATGLSLYDDLARHAGAGTLVPITGFANAIASPAIEFHAEGLVTGTCVKMFSIAGPVLVYGLSASVVYGLVCFLWQSVL